VIHRIFYKQDKSGSGRLSFRDLKRYDALALRTQVIQNMTDDRLDHHFDFNDTVGSSLLRLKHISAHDTGVTPSIKLTALWVACRGDLLHALALLDEEEDINKVLKYFSYEHFYVIYCKVS
jgi:hypothetical protein